MSRFSMSRRPASLRRKLASHRSSIRSVVEAMEVRIMLSAYVVNTTLDLTDPISSTTVSLRDAITRADSASGPASITFSTAVFATPKTISLTQSGLLAFTSHPSGLISVTGPAAGVTINIAATTVLDVEAGAGVAMHDTNITGNVNDGAGVLNYGTLSIDHATISNLDGPNGFLNMGTLTLTDSLVTSVDDSGLVNAAITNMHLATIDDCTLSGNTLAAFENQGTAVITDSTITGNTDAGLINDSGDSLTLSNSVVANNEIEPADPTAGDVSGAIHSLGHNLIGEKDGSTGWLSSDHTGTIAHPLSPKLSALGNYGGVTQTQFPLPGSPLLGAGSAALVPSGVTTDQRGFSRIVGGKVDIGAFQSQSTNLITITPPALQHAVAGTSQNVLLGSFTDPGGTGPFVVTVGWGDGSANTVFTGNAAGSLGTRAHAFVATGTLTGSLVIVDGAGDLKSSSFTISSTAVTLKTIVVNTINDVTDPVSSATVSLRDAINRADASFGPVDITFSPTVFATAKTIALKSSIPDLKNNHFGVIDLIGPAAGVTVFSHTVYVYEGGHGQLFPTENTFTVDAGISASFSNMTFKELGFVNTGSISLTDTTITGNMVVGNGAGIANYGVARLQDSTISGNYAQVVASPGGDSAGYGGGIENGGTLTVINSTISGNSSDLQGGGIDNFGTATIFDSTISGNGSSTGSGICSLPSMRSSHPKVTLANTIVAHNGTTNSLPDISGAIISSGHNLIGARDGSTGWTSTDLTGTVAHPLSANLSALGNNGGPTQTMIPLPGSPALGAGSVSLIPSGATTDQRGLARVVLGKVDIGSAEIQQRTPYFGSPAPFTTIQAENFDKGGQGAAYYNPGDVNEGGVYRPNEGVGVGPIPTADGGGYAVGYTRTGEFLDYTVSVAATGTYTVNFRVSSQLVGGKFHLDVDGVNVTGTLSVPSTGSLNTYVIVSKAGVHLTSGTHLLTLAIDAKSTAYSGAGNFDWIQAVKTDESPGG